MTESFPSSIVQEVIAVSDRGNCELDLWVSMNDGTRRYSTRDLDYGAVEAAVMEIAAHLSCEVVGAHQSAHRYIFNLTPNYIVVRQFEYQGNETVLKDYKSVDDPVERNAAMHSLSSYLKEVVGFDLFSSK